jgi:hypothetical protein
VRAEWVGALRCTGCDAWVGALRCTGYDAMRCARAGCIRAVRYAARDAMQCAARGLVAVAGAGSAMLLTMVFFGGWLSRFKLIRLRRISLTLPRYGLMDGYQYILLPASGRWSHSPPR